MKRIGMLAVVVALVPTLVFAQAKAVEDKKAITFNEIERGFFVQVNGGFWGTINPPAANGSKQYFSPGQLIQVEMGYDIGERVSPGLFFHASNNRAGSDYTGLSKGVASGDYGMIAPGVGAKFRIVGFDDAQDVKRTWFYVHAGAGLVFYSPSTLLPTSDIIITAGPGFEYFTRLRHFSIGIEADFNFMALTQSLGFSIFPTVRYAF